MYVMLSANNRFCAEQYEHQIRRFVIDSRLAVFDSTVYVVKHTISSIPVGSVPAGKYIAFDLNNIESVSNGDNVGNF